MEKKIVVPEGMIEAAIRGLGIRDGYERYCNHHRDLAQAALESALRWLSENPIEPDEEQRAALARYAPYEDSGNGKVFAHVVMEWQRRMFLAPAQKEDLKLTFTQPGTFLIQIVSMSDGSLALDSDVKELK